MGRISIAYIHEGKWPPGSVDIHIIEKSLRKAVFAAILLIPIACIFLSLKEISATLILWRLQLSGLLVILLFFFGTLFTKLSESVIIMPAFGVQLETHCTSGRIIRRFIPAGEILKPVLLECVTPVTCYWSLSLLVRGKEELVLVFKELHPPMKMLLPVWKALCASIDNKEGPDTCGEGEDG
ncbi:hypothetical protein ES319_D03G001700v1 [Gossypium barbadense]|uniref:Phosphatidylinositol N-acetylglucosaminyltransferase subunit H conserved domain-containing protein n=2 Tax=Gossypium TaxID=3633 RepID=A0A5J5RZS7_GOSBA|nr:hypothetical protein ES319_D03G001700v1 [Gossypium barbadense]TYG75099.1 hypothetical protein ES288_D03G002200v1 [Gossypium darwinii]